MPSHPERVRRNYPEGVPMFGYGHLCPKCGYTCVDAPHGTWCCHCVSIALTSVSESEVPRPPLAATEPPAVQPSTDPQAVEHEYEPCGFGTHLYVNGLCSRCGWRFGEVAAE